jgi:predicted amidophosphoribosyltransferase
MILPLLFKCPACRFAAPQRAHFPLCDLCENSLMAAPPLCPSCASPDCVREGTSPGTCLRPWESPASHPLPAIRSYAALYSLLGPSYPVLRSWKYQHGPAFDRRVLKATPQIRGFWASRGPFDAVVPIPQRFRRAWLLGGSPAEKVARWAANESQAPFLPLLRPNHGSNPGSTHSHRQAELGLLDRFSHRLKFQVETRQVKTLPRDARVLLVDDFMTSGHTLHAAAQCLRGVGVFDVHVFCLGVRIIRRGLIEPDKRGHVELDGYRLDVQAQRQPHLLQGT